jgi:hypothetical protein
MSTNTGKGRFTVMSLPEGDKVEIIVDIFKSKPSEDEDPDLKFSIEKSKPVLSRIPTRLSNRTERQAASIDLFPDSQLKPSEPEPLLKNESLATQGCLSLFHDLMKTKYIEMINFHREEMLDYINNDLERQEKIMKVLDDIAAWTKDNYRLEQENVKLRKIIMDKEPFN